MCILRSLCVGHSSVWPVINLLNFDLLIPRCASGENHLILVDSDGRAWSAGHGPQTGLVHEVRTSTPNKPNFGSEFEDPSSEAEIFVTRIDFFQGVKIIGIDSGKDFNVALVTLPTYCAWLNRHNCQCDQIFQNFATLTKILISDGLFRIWQNC